MQRKEQGVSTFRFFVGVPIALLILFAIGMLFAPTSVQEQIPSVIMRFLMEFGVKIGLMVLWVFVMAFVVFPIALDTPLTSLQKRCQESNNDSLAILFAALLVCAGIVFASTSGSIRPYLFGVMTKGTLGVALAIVLSMLVSLSFGVRSLDAFRDWLYTQDNDSYAYLVAGSWIASIILAMSISPSFS